jgi:hypothetical protein
MRPIPTASLITAAFSAALIFTVPAGVAHEWHPLSCCSGIDCGPADPGEIRFTPAGWLVVPTSELISFEKAQVSPDGRFHRCTMKAHDPKSKTRCLFVPEPSS